MDGRDVIMYFRFLWMDLDIELDACYDQGANFMINIIAIAWQRGYDN